MTYGPPNPQYPAGPNPQQPGPPPFGAAQVKASPAQAILAPTAAPNQKSLIVGAAAAVAGLLIIVCGFLNWLSLTASFSESIPGAGDMSMEIEMSVNGVGSHSASIDVSLPDSIPSSTKDEIEANAAKEFDSESQDGDGPGSPAVWTIIFGALVVIGGAMIAVRRFPGIGAVVVAVAGLASTIAAIVFVADPLGAFGGNMGDMEGGTADTSAGYGLWLTLILSFVALVGGALAVLMTVAPEKLGGSRAGALPAGPTVPGGAPGFAPGTANYGQQPAQPNYGQQPPAAPNYGQQQGQPQGGFPPVPPQGAPGQQYPGQQPPQGYGPPPQY